MRMVRTITRMATPALVVLLLFAVCSPQIRATELMICPNKTPELTSPLGSPGWAMVKANLDYYKFYINRLDPADYPEMPDLVQDLENHGVGIAVEMAGLVHWGPCDETQAQYSFNVESAKIQHLIDMGATIDMLVFDGPIRRTAEGMMAGGCEMPLDVVLDELVEVIGLYRTFLPAAQVGLLTNFPNWSYGDWPAYHGDFHDWGDYQEILELVYEALEAGAERIDFVQVDNPYDYATAAVPAHPQSTIDPTQYDWVARILALERQVASFEDVDFHMIYNSACTGAPTDARFCRESLAWASLYAARGGAPEAAMFQSWYWYVKPTDPVPSNTITETQPNTFMSIPYTWLRLNDERTVPKTADLSPTRGTLNRLTLRLPNTTRAQIEILDLNGRRVAVTEEHGLVDGALKLDLSRLGLPSGVYMARVATAEATVSTKVICVE